MAEPIFHYRSDSLNAYRAREKAAGFHIPWDNSKTAPALVSSAGAIGGNALDVKATGGWNSQGFQGYQNWVSGGAFSLLLSVVPTFTGFPSNGQGLFFCGDWSTPIHGLNIVWNTSGQINVYMLGLNSSNILSNTTTSTFSGTSGTRKDFFITWDGTATAGRLKIYEDGSLVESLNPIAAVPATWFQNKGTAIRLGYAVNGGSYCHCHFNEVALWEGVESVPTFGRSDFITSTAFDGSNSTDPGIANVKTGTSYYIAGTSYTGTYTGSDRWSDPGVANVRGGTAYKADSTTNNRTGTMTDVDALETKLTELWQMAGLDAANPMTVTTTSRSAGDVEIALTGDGVSSTTATRQP